MKKLITIFMLGFAIVANCSEYKEPAQYIKDIFDAKQAPSLRFISFESIALEMNYKRYQSLEQLAEPTVKLAGKEILPRTNAEADRYPIDHVRFFDVNTGEYKEIDLPDDIKISDTLFNSDYTKLAVVYESEDGLRLMIVDVKTGKSKIIKKVRLNKAFGYGHITWMKDDKTLIVKLIPEREDLPSDSLVPDSPIVQSTSGKKSAVRTYQNLLQSPKDEEKFDYYFTSQIAYVNSSNDKVKKIGEPGLYSSIEFSPDSQYILLNEYKKPYSYIVPYYYFPKTYKIWDTKGNLVTLLSDQPLQDQIPIGGTRKEPRNYGWQPHKEATLYWVEALDNGDPKVEVEHRDKVMQLAAPFEAEPVEIFRTKHRFSYIEWSSQEDELIYFEYDRDDIWLYTYLFNIATGKKELIQDRSYNDVYSELGDLLHKQADDGSWVFIKQNNKIFLNNDGASKTGKRPYIESFDLNTKEKNILFQCREGYYEIFQCFNNKDLSKIIISSQSKTEWPNNYIVDLATGDRKQITFNKNPNPQIENLKSELIYYTRKDSVPLSGKLYLPPNYQKGNKLPLILHAYPQEFTDKSTAGQVNSSNNTYPRFWGASLKYLVLEGYAVLQNASIPIIGDPETVNDTFVEQLNSSVEAAITYLDDIGIIDPEKVGCIGHSYGAFMVANILAHSDLCATGIAKSGAYNRTLTPFGFQSERRTFWQAPDFYLKVSPFMNADKINEPLMLIHGENDPNSGTFPIQSKRMYQALKGIGGTAKLVILPLEGHGYYARKSNLHVIAEMIEWFDKYLKY